MLSRLGNMVIRGNNQLLEKAKQMLEARLPEAWAVEMLSKGDEIDAFFRIVSPDKARATVAVEGKLRLEPRQAVELASSLRRLAEPSLVVAPYLSPSTRTRLLADGVNFLDLTGNVRIALSKPGLFIDTGGKDVDPNAAPRRSRTLRGAKAGRVVRTLMDRKSVGGVREIAAVAGVDPGYVSRLLALLDREAVIERGPRGRIAKVDWPRLLRKWAEDAPLESRGPQVSCLEPRGLATLLDRLADRGSNEPAYCVTGSYVANKFAPVSPSRLLTIYVREIEVAIRNLGLRRAEAGANVLLIEPSDDGVFVGARSDGGVTYTALSQAAADLLGSPGRGPAEGEALIQWMTEHEEVWMSST